MATIQRSFSNHSIIVGPHGHSNQPNETAPQDQTRFESAPTPLEIIELRARVDSLEKEMKDLRNEVVALRSQQQPPISESLSPEDPTAASSTAEGEAIARFSKNLETLARLPERLLKELFIALKRLVQILQSSQERQEAWAHVKLRFQNAASQAKEMQTYRNALESVISALTKVWDQIKDVGDFTSFVFHNMLGACSSFLYGISVATVVAFFSQNTAVATGTVFVLASFFGIHPLYIVVACVSIAVFMSYKVWEKSKKVS